jgi:lysophospholipase L1-like esterase
LTDAASFNHKSGITQQISNFTQIGTQAANRFQSAVRVAYGWTGGTPTATASGSITGLYIPGNNNGFALTVPADATSRTLRLYIGAYRARGQLTVSLGDNSVSPYTTTVDNSSGPIDRVINLDYSANGATTLNIQYTIATDYGVGGNITLSAATLSIPPSLPISDDFTSSSGNWTTVDDTIKTSSWSITGGMMQEQSRVERAPTSANGSYHTGTYAYYPLGLGLKNYRFSFDARYLGAKLADDIGIMFRYLDNNNYYRLSMNSRYGFTRLEKKVAGTFSPLAVNARGYAHIGDLLHFTVEVNESSIQVWVNNEPLFSVQDTSLTSGTVALYTQDVATFDNVLIDVPATTPSVIISSPVAATVNPSNIISSSAVAANVPVGGGIEFLLDGTNSILDTSPPYLATFAGVSQGNHSVDAIIRNASNVELGRDTNTLVGVQGDYYIAVGDSITNGEGDTYASDNQSERIIGFQGYENSLTVMLGNSLSIPVIIYNEGIGGDASVDTAFSRINSILARHPGANKVLLQLGTNDANSSVPSGAGCTGTACNGTYKGNMQSLINTLTTAGFTVYTALPPPIFGSSTIFTNPATASINTNYILQYHSVVINELTNRQLGPNLYTYFLGSGENRFSMFYDELHPDSLGHAVISVLWHNALDPSAPVALPFVLNNLSRSTISPYIKQNLLETGDIYYVDGTYTLTSIPPALTNGVWIMPASSDVNNTSESYISFNTDRSVTVYIAYDAGATALPNWMGAFTPTGTTLGTTDPLSPTLNVYSRNYPAGTITLGGNRAAGASGADSNYIVTVVPN